MSSRTVASFAVAVVLASFGAARISAAPASVTNIRKPMPPAVSDLQAFRGAEACSQHPGAPNCADALAHGLILFSWRCDNCDQAWNPVFVVNGQAAKATDAKVAPSKTVALSVRADQFKATDCVAIRMVNPANPGQNITSNTVCMAQVAAPARAVKAAASVILPTPTPAKGITQNSAAALAVIKRGPPAPTGMSNTLDSKVCTQHGGFGGGLGCAAGLPNGMLALVWSCNNCKADGYRLFRVDGGRHEPVAIPANGGDVTIALLDAPQGGFAGRCYAVAAYQGSNESELSNAFCAGGGSIMATASLSPQHVRYSMRGRSKNIGILSSDGFSDSGGSLVAGASHTTRPTTLGDGWTNEIFHGGIHFDLSSLSHKHIYSAKLHVQVGKSDLNGGATDQRTSCASIIGTGLAYWWTSSEWIEASRGLTPGQNNGPDVAYDVTPIVVGWANGTQNFGFVLMGDDEDLNAFTTNQCKTTYTSTISLEVKYSG
jgi:hypothetical protein